VVVPDTIAAEYYSLVPRKTSSLPAVHAPDFDQNIGRPLQKMFSYRCSTTLVFKDFGVGFEHFELWPVKQA
jgi:hypothetical protein